MKTQVHIKLRKATPEDLKVDDKTLKLGQPFWYKSLKTGEFSNQAYFITNDIDVHELSWQLDHGMIWVPVGDIWINDYKKREL
jgi:hypothetical protein